MNPFSFFLRWQCLWLHAAAFATHRVLNVLEGRQTLTFQHGPNVIYLEHRRKP